jgi:hypothetical protein
VRSRINKGKPLAIVINPYRGREKSKRRGEEKRDNKDNAK